ncbi:HNH endonuclease [Chitinimonas naiadis]
MSSQQVLTLDISGRPYAWLDPHEAVTHYAKGRVAWELGRRLTTFHGGRNRHGLRSLIEVAPIIAIAGSQVMASLAWAPLPLSDRDNALLFRRDRWICAYCGQQFQRRFLTRDHILARCRGGRDSWTNCVTACRDCNQAKGSRMVEDFRPLIYVPYAPCRYEHFLLSGRNVLADQHDYLAAKLPRYSRSRQH